VHAPHFMASHENDWKDCRLTYGITPPKSSLPEERRREIAAVQTGRIAALPIDALIVYDLQDESSRTDVERPFPFMQTIDPLDYAYDYLDGVSRKKIVYRSVSGLDLEGLLDWLRRLEQCGGATVLVGAPSQVPAVRLPLGDAYRIRKRAFPQVPLGGVLIAERHETSATEDVRFFRKMDHGCSFFVTQAAYSVSASKNVLSDLYYRGQSEEREIPPILVTLSPCGSKKTLEFMRWLGVSVPRWLQNELLHAHDILEKSIDLSISGFQELYAFAQEKGMTLGCNVESVSLRRAEIDASVEMLHRVAKIMERD
jgi:hypothetical protein